MKLDEVPLGASSDAAKKRIRTKNIRLGEKYGTGAFKEMAIQCDADGNEIQVVKMKPGAGQNVEYSGPNVRTVAVKQVVNAQFDGKDVCASKQTGLVHAAGELPAAHVDLDPEMMRLLLGKRKKT